MNEYLIRAMEDNAYEDGFENGKFETLRERKAVQIKAWKKLEFLKMTRATMMTKFWSIINHSNEKIEKACESLNENTQ